MATVFNRTVQKAEEAFKTSEKTPLDSHLETLTQDCNIRNKWAQSLLGLTEAVVEPNPASRIEDKVLSNFDRKKERSSVFEKLGESMTVIGENLGSSSAHGAALTKCGQCQNAIGTAEHEFQQAVELTYLNWLRGFVNNTCKSALAEREKLENLRLDLDRAKNQLKRAGNDEAKKARIQQQVTDAQKLFDGQCTLTKNVLEKCISEFDNNKDQLQRLVSAQQEYYEKCLKAVQQALR